MRSGASSIISFDFFYRSSLGTHVGKFASYGHSATKLKTSEENTSVLSSISMAAIDYVLLSFQVGKTGTYPSNNWFSFWLFSFFFFSH